MKNLIDEVLDDNLDVEALLLPDIEPGDENNVESAIGILSRDDIIKELAGRIAQIYITDTGDLRLLLVDLENFIRRILPGSDDKCTRRRVKDLARAWRGVIDAAKKPNIDVNEVYQAAVHFRGQAIGRSRMYNRCYKSMRRRSRNLAKIADIGLKILAVWAGAG